MSIGSWSQWHCYKSGCLLGYCVLAPLTAVRRNFLTELCTLDDMLDLRLAFILRSTAEKNKYQYAK